MKQFANDSNFPAVYQLLPSPSANILYDSATNKYIPYDDPSVITAFGLSTPNLTAAQNYRQALNPGKKPTTVSYSFVYATGQRTDEYLEKTSAALSARWYSKILKVMVPYPVGV